MASTRYNVRMKDVLEKVAKAQDLYYENKFSEAEKLMDDAEHPFYLAFKANLVAQRAALTFEREEISEAVKQIESAKVVMDEFRRNDGILSKVLSFVVGRNFDDFSEDDLNCEVAYAEMILIKSMMDFIEGESLVNFVKAAVGINISYQLYRELYGYINHTSQELSPTFISSVFFGYGTFTLYLSMIPQKVLDMLEFVGVHGNMNEGLDVLQKGEEAGGITSDICAIVLLHFNLMICNYVRMPINNDLTDKLLSKYTSRYPKSVIFNLLAGKRYMTLQNPRSAEKVYEQALKEECEWLFIKFTIHLELSWSSLAIGNWEKAVHHAKVQYEESNRTRTFFAYLQMICHYRWKPSDVEEQVRLAKLVPIHQLTIAGKHLHIEKFCIRKARSFLKNKNFLFCPVYELLYFFGFTSCVDAGRRAIMQNELEAALNYVDTPSYSGYKIDDKCLGRLILADLHRLNGDNSKAKQELETILQSEDSLKIDHMIAPYTHFELGYILAEEGNISLARAHFNTAKNYSSKVKSYSLEDTLLMKTTTQMNRIEREVVLSSR